MSWFSEDPDEIEITEQTTVEKHWQYKWAYLPSWTWIFVAFLFISFLLTKYPQLGACNTATDPTNYLTSTNGTCVPGNYDNLDVTGLAVLSAGLLIGTLNMWIDVVNFIARGAGLDTVSYFKAGPLNEWFKFSFVLCYIFFNSSAFSPLTTKTTATMGTSVINANVTYQPYNFRLNTTDPSQISAMFFLVLAGLIWLGSIYFFVIQYTQGGKDVFVVEPNARTVSALSTFFLMISVASNIGPMWYYNVGATFPSSFYGRQLITASAGLFAIPLFYSLLIVSYWLRHADSKGFREWFCGYTNANGDEVGCSIC